VEEIKNNETQQLDDIKPEDNTQSEPAEQEEKDTTCPHCGMDTTIPKVTVSDEDKTQWLRYILSGGKYRFTKEYSMYGGKIKFVLRTRTVQEDRDIDAGLPIITGDIINTSDINRMRREVMKLQLVYSLDSLTYDVLPDGMEMAPSAFIAVSASDEEIMSYRDKNKTPLCVEKFNTQFNTIPTHVLAIIVDKLIDFNVLCSLLTIEGPTENF